MPEQPESKHHPYPGVPVPACEAAGVKAGAVVAWIKEDFGLGHGHAMAIVALLKGKKSDHPPKETRKT